MTIILALFTYVSMSNNNKELELDLDLMMKSSISLRHKVLWTECEGCGDEELTAVIDVIKKRKQSKYFPNTIDSILLQKNQFAKPSSDTISIIFKQKVDKIFNQPIKYHFLYFANLKYVHNPKILKWINKHTLYKIGDQHFFK